MEKKRVLVSDSQGAFLKMFKRKFKEEFDFIEDSFFNRKETKEFDHILLMIHNHNELLNFLALEKKESNVLVCLFNLQFYRSLSFLAETNNLILFDESKTRNEILKELKTFFETKSDSKTSKTPFLPLKFSQKKVQEYYKAMYFLM